MGRFQRLVGFISSAWLNAVLYLTLSPIKCHGKNYDNILLRLISLAGLPQCLKILVHTAGVFASASHTGSTGDSSASTFSFECLRFSLSQGKAAFQKRLPARTLKDRPFTLPIFKGIVERAYENKLIDWFIDWFSQWRRRRRLADAMPPPVN